VLVRHGRSEQSPRMTWDGGDGLVCLSCGGIVESGARLGGSEKG
jgi:hypothetical protein